MQGYHGQGSCLRQAAKPSPINGTQSQFSCKKTIPLDMWDVKGNCAKGRSKEALQINRELDNIKAQIIKHYQHLSDREAFVTAEMVRNSYQGFGSEYETLLSAFDKDIANQKKRVGKDRAASTLWAMERSRKDVEDFIQSHYHRTDMSMLELTPEFIKDFAAYLSTERGLASGTIWQRCMWLKGVVIMGSVLVIILSISEQLQMKRLLVLTTVGLRHQRREHILILHSVSFSQDFEP